nr:EAL domain-containing protein [Colwellia sp. UCD-KL20]
MSIPLLCQKLIETIEGIETKEQRDKLLSLGCKYAQGYYLGKPMLSQELTLLLGNLAS